MKFQNACVPKILSWFFLKCIYIHISKNYWLLHEF